MGQTRGKLLQRLLVRHFAWWVLIVIVLISASIRYGLLDVPLERDEGEYAYAAQLLLKGIPPYQQMYNMKLPGIYAAYAGMLWIFGQTRTGIHLGLLVINAATIVLIFLLARRIIDPLAGVMAAASFAVLSIGPSTQGLFANAEHFVILPAAGGLILLVRALEDNRIWMLSLSGLLLGIGFIMKQHGAAFVAFGGAYTLIHQARRPHVNWLGSMRRCGLFAIGAMLPYGLTCLILTAAGVFENFWFWTVDYALAYVSQVTTDLAWFLFKFKTAYVIRSAPMIWMLAGLSLTALMWDKRARRQRLFITMFVLFSFVAICPGFYFRPHYFILLLPAASLLTGIGISGMANMLSSSPARFLPILVGVACLSMSVDQQRFFLFQATPAEASRIAYGFNPFPESIEISRYIRAHTRDNDRIAVIGSEPQIYFYSGRQSASGYVYMYPLMEAHDFAVQMQKEMIQEIKSVQPEFLVYVHIETSWLDHPGSHKLLLEWFKKYQSKHYKIVGLVDLLQDNDDLLLNKTVYHWAPNVKWPPSSSSWIAVLKRKK